MVIEHLGTIDRFSTIKAGGAACLQLLSTVSGVLCNFYFISLLSCRICILTTNLIILMLIMMLLINIILIFILAFVSTGVHLTASH